jgi:hypothetical protein
MTTKLSNEEYEMRRHFLEDLKILSKTEHMHMFDLIKKESIEYTENSNGVFFDISKVSADMFQVLYTYMNFCKTTRTEQTERDEEERKAQELLR